MSHQLQTPDAQDMLIVGASGDLTRRKLLPALYNLFVANLLPAEGKIIGLARTRMDTPQFIQLAHDAVMQFSRTGLDEEAWAGFTRRLTFVHLEDGAFDKLAQQAG